MSGLQVSSISIQKTWNKDTYDGVICFTSEQGSVSVKLDNELSNQVLKLCAESMTRVTKELADNLTASIFEQAGVPQIESKEPSRNAADDIDDLPF